MTDEERLSEIRQRAHAASDGPWSHEHGRDRERYGFRIYDRQHRGVCKPTRGDAPQDEANSEFIKHSREDVPYLLDLVARLLAEQTRLQQENEQETLHPIRQVYFRAGLLACREYMARFVEAQDPAIAMSIRANWWPALGPDFGAPRKLDFSEVTSGEFGTPEFRVKTADEVSPTQEALPIALGFLQQGNEAPPVRPSGRSDTKRTNDEGTSDRLL